MLYLPHRLVETCTLCLRIGFSEVLKLYFYFLVFKLLSINNVEWVSTPNFFHEKIPFYMYLHSLNLGGYCPPHYPLMFGLFIFCLINSVGRLEIITQLVSAVPSNSQRICWRKKIIISKIITINWAVHMRLESYFFLILLYYYDLYLKYIFWKLRVHYKS